MSTETVTTEVSMESVEASVKGYLLPGMFAKTPELAMGDKITAQHLRKDIELRAKEIVRIRERDEQEFKQRDIAVPSALARKVDYKEVMERAIRGQALPHYQTFSGNELNQEQERLEDAIRDLKRLFAASRPSHESFADDVETFPPETEIVEETMEMIPAKKTALDEVTEEINQAGNDIASMESLLTALDSARNVGMEHASYQFAKHVINPIRGAYGIQSQDVEIPSMEDFQGRQVRLATEVSMESVKETIKKIWEWIKAKFIQLCETIGRFLDGYSLKVEAMTIEANRLKKIAQQSKFEAISDKISLGSDFDRICVEGEVSDNHVGVLNQVGALLRIPGELNERADKLVKYFEANIKNPMQLTYSFDFIPSGFNEVDASQGSNVKYYDSKVKQYMTPVLPGDRVILLTSTGDNELSAGSLVGGMDLTTGRQMLYYGLMIVPINQVKNPDRTGPALNASDMFALCQRIVKTLASMKTALNDMKQFQADLNRRVEASVRNVTSVEGPATSLTARFSGWVFKTGSVYTTNVTTACIKITLDVCRGYIGYCRRSLPADLK